MSHPPEEHLVDLATGAETTAVALITACHVALCPDCHATVAALAASGGLLLAGLSDDDRDGSALEAAIFAQLDEAPVAALEPIADPILPGPLVRLVGPSHQIPWRRLLPGVQIHRVTLPDPHRVHLLRFAPRFRPPIHRHTGLERTLVLQEGYTDPDRGHFGRGDVQILGDEDHVQHMDDDGCIALFVNDGPLVPRSWLGRWLAPFVDV